jgi:hypothetical protein
MPGPAAETPTAAFDCHGVAHGVIELGHEPAQVKAEPLTVSAPDRTSIGPVPVLVHAPARAAQNARDARRMRAQHSIACAAPPHRDLARLARARLRIP